jgi:hypothetical protein
VRLLPYLHPLWQIGALIVALWTLALGLRMRALRRRRSWHLRALLVDRHARGGLAFVSALLVGYAAGPLTLALVRDEPVFESGHAFFATLVLLPLLVGSGLGLRLWRGVGAPRERELHAFCMTLGLLLALIALIFGLDLLP